jgi:hypothetical protein
MLPSFPDIEPDQDLGYVLILKDETCTERLSIEEVHNLINNGIEYECVCKLTKFNL